MKHELPKLTYEYFSLEPFIDSRTMEIHHTKHHQAYVNNLNLALDKYTELYEKDVEWLLKNLAVIPEEIRVAVRNNGGGHYNHSMFWKFMKRNSGGSPRGPLLEALQKDFGSFDSFKEVFTKVALTRFGSGWAWLVADKNKTLSVLSTPNQDNPIMDSEVTPILGLDVWEHAYYLKYQNKRVDYVEAWWNIVNWDEVERLFSL